MYFDSHTHLNSPDLFPNYEMYINNFLKIGGKKLVNVGVDFERNDKAIKIKNHFPEVCIATVGFHPSEAVFKKEYIQNEKSRKDYLQNVESYLKKSIQNENINIIGEIGLDYHYPIESNELIEKQKQLFSFQMDIALAYNLPVVIHSRDAFEDTMKILEKYKNMKIYFHCWGYDKEEVDIVQKIFTNVRIGYDGNITYKQAGNIRNSILNTNINNILIETDAPFLTPQIIRKEKNQPSNIIYIYDYISTLLKIDLSTLQKKINTNFNNFYDL